MKVAVGSKNPVKIASTKQAFEKVFPEETWSVEGIEVDSGVSSQPMSDTESITGARNRAIKALKLLHADFGVGLEGGIHEIDGKWFDSGWMVVIDKKNNEGIGASIKMQVSPIAMQHIQAGKELGIATDLVFKTKNSKHGDGHFGLMSKNAITRMSGYTDGVIAALTRFVHEELF